jgi:hypothetical protein
VSADEAADVIGIALIQSLSNLSGQNGVKTLAGQMESLAQSTANVITNLGKIAKFGKDIAPVAATLGVIALAFTAIGTGGATLAVAASLARIFTSTKFLASLGLIGAVFGLTKDFSGPKTSDVANRNENRARAEQAAKASKARKNEIKERTKIVSLTKAQAANEKLSRMFDMDAIQLAAALQGKLSKEDEARVKALQALKTEDKNDDIRAIEELEAAKRAATFAEIARMKLVVEDSKKSNAEIIADARTRIAAIQGLVSGVGSSAAQNFVTGITGIAAGTGIGAGPTNLPVDVSNMPTIGGGRDLIDEFNMEGTRSSAGPSSVTVNVNPTGSGFIGNVDDFERIVQTAVQSLNTAGNSLTRAGG